MQNTTSTTTNTTATTSTTTNTTATTDTATNAATDTTTNATTTVQTAALPDSPIHSGTPDAMPWFAPVLLFSLPIVTLFAIVAWKRRCDHQLQQRRELLERLWKLSCQGDVV